MAATEVVWTTKNADRAVAIAVASATRALQLGTKKPPAAVFDIDETLLRNRADDRVSVQSAGKRMYEWAATNHVDIYLLTARRKSPDAFAFAKKQLSKLGYDLSAVRKVYMVSQEYDDDEDAGCAVQAKRSQTPSQNPLHRAECRGQVGRHHPFRPAPQRGALGHPCVHGHRVER